MPTLPSQANKQDREAYNAYFRAYREANREKLRAYNRAYNKRWRKEHGYHNEAKWRDEHPTQVAAQQKLRRNLIKGKVKKYWCEVCHDHNTVAHHDDYRKPLEVRWLCRLHHRKWHYGGRLTPIKT